MEKRFKLTCMLLIAMVMLVLGGCSSISDQDQERVRTTQETAVKYLAKKYGIETEFTYYKISPPDFAHTVGHTGHIKGQEEEEVFVLVNYDNMQIESVSVPEGIKEIE